MAKKEKKPETKAQKIINIVIMTIEIIIIIACIALSATVIIGAKTTTEELGTGFNLTAVLTESMNGTLSKDDVLSIYSETSHAIGSFAAGDLLFIESVSEEDRWNIKVGDVVTYVGNVAGTKQLITHRVVKIEYIEDQDLLYFYTLGDAERATSESMTLEEKEEYNVSMAKRYIAGAIQGVVTGVVPNVGTVIAWFQNSKNFLWSVVIPLAVLLAYNLYELIRMVIAFRIKKVEQKSKEEIEALKLSIAQSAVGQVDSSLEEEIKRKAIEEYLAKMATQNEEQIKVSDIQDESVIEDKPVDAENEKKE